MIHVKKLKWYHKLLNIILGPVHVVLAFFMFFAGPIEFTLYGNPVPEHYITWLSDLWITDGK